MHNILVGHVNSKHSYSFCCETLDVRLGERVVEVGVIVFLILIPLQLSFDRRENLFYQNSKILNSLLEFAEIFKIKLRSQAKVVF